MSVKDKIIFGVLVVLIGVAGYFQYIATNMIVRMDELNRNDSEHVDVVHNEFREDLRKLNLQFIGRGKHLQKAQQDIIANTKYIEYVTDSLGNAIQEVQYNLDELDRTVAKQFANVEDDIQDLTDSFNRERRRSKGERAEIKQTITVMQSEIKVLNDKVFGVPEEEKDKKKKFSFNYNAMAVDLNSHYYFTRLATTHSRILPPNS